MIWFWHLGSRGCRLVWASAPPLPPPSFPHNQPLCRSIKRLLLDNCPNGRLSCRVLRQFLLGECSQCSQCSQWVLPRKRRTLEPGLILLGRPFNHQDSVRWTKFSVVNCSNETAVYCLSKTNFFLLYEHYRVQDFVVFMTKRDWRVRVR